MKLAALTLLSSGLIVGNAYAEVPDASQTTQPATVSTTSTTVTKTTTTAKNPGEAFLENNKLQPGVVTLPDGLQYKVITEGAGEAPTNSDTVTVNYEGKLIDGKIFDSSYQRGEPATFPVSAVIPGWTEALKLMKVGSVFELYIPAALAYGEHGAPPAIGPNETLIFKVELLGINHK